MNIRKFLFGERVKNESKSIAQIRDDIIEQSELLRFLNLQEPEDWANCVKYAYKQSTFEPEIDYRKMISNVCNDLERIFFQSDSSFPIGEDYHSVNALLGVRDGVIKQALNNLCHKKSKPHGNEKVFRFQTSTTGACVQNPYRASEKCFNTVKLYDYTTESIRVPNDSKIHFDVNHLSTERCIPCDNYIHTLWFKFGWNIDWSKTVLEKF